MSTPTTAKWIVDHLLSKWTYFADDDPVIPTLWVRGSCPLFLVLGENAAGKSFFRRCVHLATKKFTAIEEVIHLSMEARGSGSMMYGPVQAMVYGDEGHQSTGENSAQTIRGAIKTCQGREHAHLLYWDEPDVGMSESTAAGAGIAIADFVCELPVHTRGVFVTTHSRPLVAELRRVGPHYLHLGVPPEEAPQSVDEWLAREITPVSPDEVLEASRARFKAIQKILNEVRQRA